MAVDSNARKFTVSDVLLQQVYVRMPSYEILCGKLLR